MFAQAGETPLMFVSRVENTQIAKVLLEAKASMAVPPRHSGENAGDIRYYRPSQGDCVVILKGTAAVVGRIGTTVFYPAGQAHRIRFLNGHHVGVKSATDICRIAVAPPIWLACMWSSDSMVELLLQAKADASVADPMSCVTCLMLASERDDVKIARALLEAHANVNAQNKVGDTALDVAIKADHSGIAKYLRREAGAQEYIRNQDGDKPRDLEDTKVVEGIRSEYRALTNKTQTGLERVKLVVVGDGAVSKTHMLISYTTDDFPEDVPKVFDNCQVNVMIDGRPISLDLWDTASDLNNLDDSRRTAYFHADVFVVCYSILSPTSLKNVGNKWLPEIRQHCPNTPFLLVGCKCDYYHNPITLERLKLRAKGKFEGIVQQNHAYATGCELSAACVIPCSARSGANVNTVFDKAVKVVLAARSRKSNSASIKTIRTRTVKRLRAMASEVELALAQGDLALACSNMRKFEMSTSAHVTCFSDDKSYFTSQTTKLRLQLQSGLARELLRSTQGFDEPRLLEALHMGAFPSEDTWSQQLTRSQRCFLVAALLSKAGSD